MPPLSAVQKTCGADLRLDGIHVDVVVVSDRHLADGWMGISESMIEVDVMMVHEWNFYGLTRHETCD